MPLDFDAKSRAYRRLGWRKPSGPGCLTFRLPVVRVRLGRKIETADSIWKISLTSLFPKVGRVSPRSYEPVEIGALAQTKRETLVAEAGTETCRKRLCFGERYSAWGGLGNDRMSTGKVGRGVRRKHVRLFNRDTAKVVTTFELTQVSAASGVVRKARPVL